MTEDEMVGWHHQLNGHGYGELRELVISREAWRAVVPVVMYGCESWTVKKAEQRRIDAFELRCWRRLLRVR